MIIVAEKYNFSAHRRLIDQMFRLRAHVFHEKLKWNVSVTDGLERDALDEQDPVYLIYCDPEGTRVFGSLRLLPTTGPTLIASAFADTVPDVALLTAPSIWECTRFCVDERHYSHRAFPGVVYASGVLLAALGEVALESGIASILGNFDLGMYRLYRRIGLDVEVLGKASRNGSTIYLGSFPVTEMVLRRVKAGLPNVEREIVRPGTRSLAA